MIRYFHVVVGLDHQSSFPLLVYRVCEGLQRCIHPTNFKIVVHSLNKVQVNKPTHKMTMQFLNDVGIDVHSWVGNFTANFKMVKSLETLKGIDDEDRWIYHSGRYDIPFANFVILYLLWWYPDLDEVPEDAPFSQGVRVFISFAVLLSNLLFCIINSPRRITQWLLWCHSVIYVFCWCCLSCEF